MNIPCPNPSLCYLTPNPSTSYSSEAVDKQVFIGLAWSNEMPRLGIPFDKYPCFSITESQLSQIDADLYAARQVASCPDPCNPIFSNTAQTAIGECSDNTLFFYTVSSGLFSASSQLLADRMAFTFAFKQLLQHRICLSSLIPTAVCAGSDFDSTITITGNFSPFSASIVSGQLPPGITLDQPNGKTISIKGTCPLLGSYEFTLEVRDSAGSYMRKNYQIDVVGIDTDSNLPDSISGVAYTTQLNATGLSLPITWSIASGSLPSGLILNKSTGIISGTPNTPGSYGFSIEASSGPFQCSKSFALTVNNIFFGMVWSQITKVVSHDPGSFANGSFFGNAFSASVVGSGSYVGAVGSVSYSGGLLNCKVTVTSNDPLPPFNNFGFLILQDAVTILTVRRSDFAVPGTRVYNFTISATPGSVISIVGLMASRPLRDFAQSYGGDAVPATFSADIEQV